MAAAGEKRKVKMAVEAPSFRPTVVGTHHAVATGHYLATAAAMRILDGGGNAIDAGVTAAVTLAMLQPDMVSFGGGLEITARSLTRPASAFPARRHMLDGAGMVIMGCPSGK